MIRNQELERLHIRKLELLAQSQSNRAQLAATWARLRGPASTLERGISFFRKTRYLWMLAAPVLGFFAAKKWRKLGQISSTAVFSLRLIRNLRAMWQGFRQTRAGEVSASQPEER